MIRVKDIALIAIFTAVIFVQEQMLLLLPNIQLTFLLIVLYSKCFGVNKTLIIITLHVFLDNLIMGSFNYLMIVFMILGYSFIPISLSTIFRKVNKAMGLAFLGILFACVFSWFLIIPGMIIQELSFIDYLLADIIFEIILAISTFVTILWLYDPVYKVLYALNSNT